MNESQFPKPVAEVIATLADIYRHQGGLDVVEVIENSHARFEVVDYDNWNGGTSTWELRFEVPVRIFAAVESRLAVIEKDILAKLGYINRLYPNDHVGGVTITPISGTLAKGLYIGPSDIELRRIWPDGKFRLFLSHVSTHKSQVSKLKSELGMRGVAAFVAHEDIEPALEWQHEIELALRSAHALAALITPDFHGSPWTDQEVGWALGRGVVVLPVRLGINPYGFAGKIQGISGNLEQPAVLAAAIVNAILVHSQTHGEMRRAIVSAFSGARSFDMAKALRWHITKIADFTEEEIGTLRKACKDNGQVSGATGVSAAIYSKFGMPVEKVGEPSDLPF